MKRIIFYAQAFLFVALALLCCSLITSSNSPLKLNKVIPLPCVKGKIEQIAVNENQQIAYLTVLGNNSLIAVNMQTEQIIHAISGLDDPQGVAYISANNSIAVTTAGDGKCTIYNATDFSEIKNISLAYDADQVRYYSSLHRIFVGYGDGGVSIINADSFNVISNIKLPAHPTSFQVDEDSQKLYINVPIAQKIVVVDLKTSATTAQWQSQETSNYSMALDTNHHRLFIVCKNSSKLEIFDTQSGNMVYSSTCSADAGDIFYNADRKEIYVSCGSGFIDVYQQRDANHYDSESKIPTRSGARTSLFVPGMDALLIAAPALPGKDAELEIYKPSQTNLAKQ